jgi:plastocyanin
MLKTVITRGALLAVLVASVVGPAAVLAQDEAMDGAAVQIQGFAFSPDRMTIPVGGTVTWSNGDGAAHTATSSTFDTGRLGQGQSASIQFDTAGEYPYNCAFHANMAGTVVVE